jgi:hypothetical protein
MFPLSKGRFKVRGIRNELPKIRDRVVKDMPQAIGYRERTDTCPSHLIGKLCVSWLLITWKRQYSYTPVLVLKAREPSSAFLRSELSAAAIWLLGLFFGRDGFDALSRSLLPHCTY